MAKVKVKVKEELFYVAKEAFIYEEAVSEGFNGLGRGRLGHCWTFSSNRD